MGSAAAVSGGRLYAGGRQRLGVRPRGARAAARGLDDAVGPPPMPRAYHDAPRAGRLHAHRPDRAVHVEVAAEDPDPRRQHREPDPAAHGALPRRDPDPGQGGSLS